MSDILLSTERFQSCIPFSLQLFAFEMIYIFKQDPSLLSSTCQEVCPTYHNIVVCFSPFWPHLNVFYHSLWYFVNYVYLSRNMIIILLELSLLSKIYPLVVLFWSSISCHPQLEILNFCKLL